MLLKWASMMKHVNRHVSISICTFGPPEQQELGQGSHNSSKQLT